MPEIGTYNVHLVNVSLTTAAQMLHALCSVVWD